MALTKGRPLPIGSTKNLPKPTVKKPSLTKTTVASKSAKTTKDAAPAVKVPAKPTGEKGIWKGYCVKCKEKEVSFDGEIFESANGNRVAKGPHKKCGTTVCRILGKAK